MHRRSEWTRKYWEGIGLSGDVNQTRDTDCLGGYTDIITDEDLWGDPGLSTMSPRHIQIVEVTFPYFLNSIVCHLGYSLGSIESRRTNVFVEPLRLQYPIGS